MGVSLRSKLHHTKKAADKPFSESLSPIVTVRMTHQPTYDYL